MTRRAMSLMDVLAPPGNDWLRELSRRKADLPAGVHIVRFSDADDEATEDSETGRGKSRRREKMTALPRPSRRRLPDQAAASVG